MWDEGKAIESFAEQCNWQNLQSLCCRWHLLEKGHFCIVFLLLLVLTLLVMIAKEKPCVPGDQRITYLVIICNALLLLAFSVTAERSCNHKLLSDLPWVK